MEFLAVIQARLTSQRLPGKILKPIGDLQLLEHILIRLKKSDVRDLKIVLAIPEGNENAMLAEVAEANNVGLYTGSEQDVLERYLGASAELKDDDYVIRLTADNPFPDIPSFNSVAAFLRENPDVDYAYPAGIPLGMGFEFIRAAALRSQKFYDLKPHHHEHVTTFIRESPALYETQPLLIGPFASRESGDIERPAIRLTVDEESDLALVRKVFEHFSKLGNPWFGARDISSLYQHMKEFFSDNLHIQQKPPESFEKG